MTITARLLDELREGPMTTAELAAGLEYSAKSTCALLCDLKSRGIITAAPYARQDRRRRVLWSLVLPEPPRALPGPTWPFPPMSSRAGEGAR